MWYASLLKKFGFGDKGKPSRNARHGRASRMRRRRIGVEFLEDRTMLDAGATMTLLSGGILNLYTPPLSGLQSAALTVDNVPSQSAGATTSGAVLRVNSSVASSSVGLTKIGSGTLILGSGNGSYSGGNLILGGTLTLANGNGLSGGSNLTLNAGTTGSIVLQNSGAASQVAHFGNALERIQHLRDKAAAVRLSSPSSAQTPSQGAGTTTAGTMSLSPGGTFNTAGSAAGTLTLTKIGPGTLRIDPLTYVGPVAVASGTLRLAGPVAIAPGTLTLNTNVTNSATITLASNGNGISAGSGVLTINQGQVTSP